MAMASGSQRSALIDIGANLTNRRFQKDLPAVLRRAAGAGLEAVVVTGTSLPASRDALALIKRHQHQHDALGLYSTVGVHPHDAKHVRMPEDIEKMRELITTHRRTVVAVGECGLDFNRDFSPRDVQERVFRAQVELACDLQMPLFLHEREAHDVFVSVLRPFAEANRLPPVVVHCFTGNQQELDTYIAMGFYVGVTGFICMDSRGFRLRTCVSRVPLDRLMIETDAPFMYPYGNNSRGRCEPKDLCAVVATLASCFRVSEDDIARHTTRNARRFFAIDPIDRRSLQSQGEIPSTVAAAGLDWADAVVIDGGQGEGGGQVLRVSMALATLMHRKLQVQSIRANRRVPGLRNQHLAAVRLVASIGDGALKGAELSSTTVCYAPVDEVRKETKWTADAKTAGSVALMIQAALPALLSKSESTTLELKGGTHVDFSPPMEFMLAPFAVMLGQFGVDVDMQVLRHGFAPVGGGHVIVTMRPRSKHLKAIDWSCSPTSIQKITTYITVHGTSVDDSTGQLYETAMGRALDAHLAAMPGDRSSIVLDFVVELVCKATQSRQRGRKGVHRYANKSKQTQPDVSVLCVAETSGGSVLTADKLGRLSPMQISEMVTNKLFDLFWKGVSTDEHLADNAAIYMALAHGTSRLRIPCKADRSSKHLETVLQIVAKFTGANFRIEEQGETALVEVNGIGFDKSQ